MKEEVYKVFRKYGRLLAIHGYVAGHGGNLSLRSGNRMFITRHGVHLEDLKPQDVIETRVDKPSSLDTIASSEILLHRAIYMESAQYLACIHTHSPYAIATSFFYDELKPIDAEASYVLKRIPVVEGEAGSQRMAEAVAKALKESHSVIVRGHGVFTAAQVIDVAYRYACLVERSAQLLYLVDVLKKLGYTFITPTHL